MHVQFFSVNVKRRDYFNDIDACGVKVKMDLFSTGVEVCEVDAYGSG
jgi:hypothetical protein